MERDPVQPPLLLFERKDCDTGGASVLITRQAVPLLLLGFWWCSSCCLPSVLQDLPWQCGTLEGKLISTWYNARVNGIDPVLYPHSGSHLQLSLHCNFLNPLLYSCFIGWSPYNLRLQPVALGFGENKMQFEYRCSFVVPPPPPPSISDAQCLWSGCKPHFYDPAKLCVTCKCNWQWLSYVVFFKFISRWLLKILTNALLSTDLVEPAGTSSFDSLLTRPTSDLSGVGSSPFNMFSVGIVCSIFRRNHLGKEIKGNSPPYQT